MLVGLSVWVCIMLVSVVLVLFMLDWVSVCLSSSCCWVFVGRLVGCRCGLFSICGCLFWVFMVMVRVMVILVWLMFRWMVLLSWNFVVFGLLFVSRVLLSSMWMGNWVLLVCSVFLSWMMVFEMLCFL